MVLKRNIEKVTMEVRRMPEVRPLTLEELVDRIEKNVETLLARQKKRKEGEK